jgi:hypothetical protein
MYYINRSTAIEGLRVGVKSNYCIELDKRIRAQAWPHLSSISVQNFTTLSTQPILGKE